MELLAAGRAARPPPGEEKLQMWDLNKRLESYLSRVKALEEENELLRAQIATLHRNQPEQGAWRAELDRELARAREAVEAAGRSRDRAELERDHLSQELGEAEGRRRQELAAQEEARRGLAEGRRALEEEKRAQIWLRERAAQLEKELQLTAETHQEDVSLLRAALAHARPSPQPAPALQPDPALQLRDLGLDYSQRAAQAWREAASSYQSQLGRLEDSLAQAQARLARLSQEKRESCLAAQGLARELEAARARKGALERSAAGQRDRQREELDKLQAHIDSLEQEKESLREQIAALLADRQNLQQLKMSLGLEVATYRALLDTESLRFKVPSASLQLNFVPRHGESGTEGVRETIQTTLARGRQVSLVSAKLLGSDKMPPPGTTGTRNKLPTMAAPSRPPVGKALKDTPAVVAPRRAEEPIKETKQERGNWDVETSRTPPQGSALPSEVQLQLPAGQSEDNREVVGDKDEQQASTLPVSHGGLVTQESELERYEEQDGATAELEAGNQEETLEPCIAALQHSSVLLERPPQGALVDTEVSDDDDEPPTKATEASAGAKDSWAPELMDELMADTHHPESMIGSRTEESHGERVTSECAWEEPLEAAGEPPLKPEEQAPPKNGSGNAEGGDEVGQWDNEEADGDDRSAADEGEGESDRLSEHEAGKDHVTGEGKGETKAEDLEETDETEQMSREEEAILAVEPPSGSHFPAEGKPSDNLNASPEMEPVDSSAEEEDSPNASQSWRTDGEELESADGYALENTLADTRSLIQYKSEEAVWDLNTQGSPEEDAESEGPMSDEEADKMGNLNIEADEEKNLEDEAESKEDENGTGQDEGAQITGSGWNKPHEERDREGQEERRTEDPPESVTDSEADKDVQEERPVTAEQEAEVQLAEEKEGDNRTEDVKPAPLHQASARSDVDADVSGALEKTEAVEPHPDQSVEEKQEEGQNLSMLTNVDSTEQLSLASELSSTPDTVALAHSESEGSCSSDDESPNVSRFSQ
uniref:Nestin n=1 Tax=Lepisosteus oculatus TaxID=7918 RepID=W5MNH6_LEPOC